MYPQVSDVTSCESFILPTRAYRLWKHKLVLSYSGQESPQIFSQHGTIVRHANANAPSQAATPSIPSTVPSTPFESIYADFFEIGGHHYLVSGDRLSGWVEIFMSPHGTNQAGAQGLVSSLRTMFRSFGIPEELSSDGGPEFTA